MQNPRKKGKINIGGGSGYIFRAQYSINSILVVLIKRYPLDIESFSNSILNLFW